MNPAYWETVAADYDREVLSVFDHDTAGLVQARVIAAGRAAPGGRAADIGCGVGKFTTLLAAAFVHVHACDRSARGLAETRARCRAWDNVTFSCFDLAGDAVPFAPVEFVLCVNVLIMPSLDERMRAWRAVTNQVAHGGSMLLVVPSVESVQFGYFSALDACLHAGTSCAESVRRCEPGNTSVADLHQGVHLLDGLRTKHYLREELERMLPAHEFDVQELVKLEYDSGVAAVPWDWLVVARRR
jgi:SAM-dependent methyltransferase